MHDIDEERDHVGSLLSDPSIRVMVSNFVCIVNVEPRLCRQHSVKIQLLCKTFTLPCYDTRPTTFATMAVRTFKIGTATTNGKKNKVTNGLSSAPVAPSNYSMSILQAKVKSCSSGDTLVLVSPSGLERSVSLAYVNAPHLKKEGDEPFAFESREFLRKQVVGKQVKFKILYTIPNTNREYGIFWLQDGTRLPEAAVEAGWLKLRDDAGRKEDSEDAQRQLNELKLLEAQARAKEIGLWQTSGGRIEVQSDLGNADAFIKEYKGQSVNAIVERVLSGDRMLLRLLISPKKHYSIMTLVAGIRAPTTERTNPSNGHIQPAEEYGNEARKFVEDRLLQREVKVDIIGVSPQGQLIAAVKHPRGSIAKFLLEEGLARCTDFHSTLLGAEMAPLREAEKSAQANKKGLYKGHVAKQTGSGGNTEVVVTRVFSSDIIYVQNKAGAEKRINISSIRGPRVNEAAEAPFRDEAKEYLRKRIIGKKVRMSIDGSRPPTTGEDGQSYDAKEVATIMLNDKNVGLQLVQEGWASVIRHKRDDPDRAPNYDELLAAGEKAKEEKKGMWSGKPAQSKTYVDQSESLQKAKLGLGTLQRQRKIPAIVDFVKAGSRFVVLVPKESMRLNFVLGGIRAPRSARNPSEKAEPFGQEAHDLAVRRLSQRDVTIDVASIDKVGGFIGELYINGESFAKILVEEGLATVHGYSAEQAGTATELNAAQSRAKEARKNLWADWDPSQDVEAEENYANGSNGDTNVVVDRKPDYREVVVSDVSSEGKIKVQMVGSGTSALETLMSAFKSFHLNPSNSGGLQGPPKAGDVVAAKFSEDGQWYRARVRANDRTAQEAEVVFIDYGNSEKQKWAKLRPLSQPQFSTSKLAPQAKEVTLSFLELPTNPEYLADFRACFAELTSIKDLVANVDYTDKDGMLFVTLYDSAASGSKTESINSAIISEGLAMVPRKLKPWERSFSDVLKQLKEVESLAKQERRGMWEYGDLTED